MGEGIYVINKMNYRVTMNDNYKMDISEESKYKLIVCNKEGCKQKT